MNLRSQLTKGASPWTQARYFVLALLMFGVVLWLSKSKPGTQAVQPAASEKIATSAVVLEPLPAALPAFVASQPRAATPTPTPAHPEQGPDQPAAAKKGPVYDPFERHGDEDPQARVLVAVSDMQLGVLKDARVHDETHLVEVLTRLGNELEKQGPESRQQLVESYQKELGRYMQGEVELRGRDWLLGLEVGEVRPLEEQHWQPRPN